MRSRPRVALIAIIALATARCINLGGLLPSDKQWGEMMDRERKSILARPVVQHVLLLSQAASSSEGNQTIDQYLNAIASDVYRISKKRAESMTSKELSTRLGTAAPMPNFSRPVPFAVYVDRDTPGEYAWAECGNTSHALPRVGITTGLLRAIALGSFEYGQASGFGEELSDPSTFVDFLKELSAGPPVDPTVYNGPGAAMGVVQHLVNLEVPVGEGQREYLKSLAFVIGHEAAHIWADRCSVPGKAAELSADVQGIVVSFELYAGRCTASIQPLDRVWLNVTDADWKSFSIDAPANLWGRRGIELVQKIYAGNETIEKDQAHAPFAERLSTAAEVGAAVEQGVLASAAHVLSRKWFGLLKGYTLVLSSKDAGKGMPCPDGDLEEPSERMHNSHGY